MEMLDVLVKVKFYKRPKVEKVPTEIEVASPGLGIGFVDLHTPRPYRASTANFGSVPRRTSTKSLQSAAIRIDEIANPMMFCRLENWDRRSSTNGEMPRVSARLSRSLNFGSS